MGLYSIDEHIEKLTAAFVELGGSRLTDDALQAIVSAYGEPQRHYHTWRHIEECLASLSQYAALANNINEVLISLCLHDVVYAPRAKNNEELSAEFADKLMSSCGIEGAAIQNVCEHILATKSHAGSDNADTCLVNDIDMMILAGSSERIREYECQIREEYSYVPKFIYRMKRKAVLKGFLKQDRIFYTQEIHDVYDKRARENIADLISLI